MKCQNLNTLEVIQVIANNPLLSNVSIYSLFDKTAMEAINYLSNGSYNLTMWNCHTERLDNNGDTLFIYGTQWSE